MIKYNFCAGPGVLPNIVLQKASSTILSYQDNISILSLSHRDPRFKKIRDDIKLKLKVLLNIGDNYEILLMSGGATAQFSSIPMNLSSDFSQCIYLNSGVWAKKALKEAKKYTGVNEIILHDHDLINPRVFLEMPKNIDYLHYTDNETIDGKEFQYVPQYKNVPVVCDMSSSFLSKKIDIDKFGLIYAGAQKNFGPAGVTVVIIKKDLLSQDTFNNSIPSIMSYQDTLCNDSLLNTPATYSWLVVNYMLDWMAEKGGITYFDELNRKKSVFLYGAIDHLKLFSSNIPVDIRSRMNVIFNLASDELTEKFLVEAENEGFYGLRGHRSVGGCRASLYNSMDFNGVQELVEFMFLFNKDNT